MKRILRRTVQKVVDKLRATSASISFFKVRLESTGLTLQFRLFLSQGSRAEVALYSHLNHFTSSTFY